MDIVELAHSENNYRVPNRRRVTTTQYVRRSFFATFVILLSVIFLLITFPLSIWFCVISIPEFKRIVIFRLGRLKKASPQGPGFVLILPFVDQYYVIDLRTISFDIPPRDILTRDAVSVQVDAVVYYHVFDPVGVVTQVADFRFATQKLSQIGLRNAIGKKTLDEFTTNKESVAISLASFLDVITDKWGIKIERVEIQEVRLPKSMRRALAAEAEATREANAKIISAEAEMQAACSLKKASDVMSTNPIALQLRYLQTLSTIASDLNHTILFPMPTEFLQKL